MSILSKLQSILSAINAKTGYHDTNITDAVKRLCMNMAKPPYIMETYDENDYLRKVELVGHRRVYNQKYHAQMYLTDVILPNSVKSIGYQSFSSCTSLRNINFPEGLERIGSDAFGYCESLHNITLPSSITNIMGGAFKNCFLNSVTFKGKPTTIANTAFNECYNLSTINVPWAEGEIADAPWGAVNATINYNYSE